MFIDPQLDVYAQYQQRKGDMEFPYRVNWEFQEQMRQHLLKTHAPDIINTTAFMNAPPSQFPQWTTPDLAQRQMIQGGAGEENPYAREYEYEQQPEGPPQEETVEELVDEHGNVVDPSTLTEEEKALLALEQPKPQSTEKPEDVQKEVETQHNSEPPPPTKTEPPPPPQKTEQQQIVDTQYNVPKGQPPTQTPPTSQQTSTETPAKQPEQDYAWYDARRYMPSRTKPAPP
jgi:hypothetical protein